MRVVRTVGCLVAVATLAVGCSDDGDGDGDDASGAEEASEQQDSGDERTDAEREADQQAAEAMLLTLGDFPAGWEAGPVEEDEGNEDLRGDLANCLGVDEDVLDSDNPQATSPTFASSNDEEVSVEVGFTPSSDEASRVLEVMHDDAMPGCYAETLRALVTRNLLTAEDLPDDVEVGEPTFNPLSFTDLGDDSVAFRTTLPVAVGQLNVDVYVDVVVVRIGRIGITATFQSQLSPFDSDQAAELVQIVVDRAPAEEAAA
jgi:hypothetical protein